MSDPSDLSKALAEWAEIFMHHSSHEFLTFIKQNELSPTHLNTMMRLYFGGSCGMSHLGDHLGITNAATSQMVQKMVEQGWLERTEDSTDRRVKQLALTPAGHALIEQAIEARRRWLENLVTMLTPPQQQNITLALTDLTAAAQKLDFPLTS